LTYFEGASQIQNDQYKVPGYRYHMPGKRMLHIKAQFGSWSFTFSIPKNLEDPLTPHTPKTPLCTSEKCNDVYNSLTVMVHRYQYRNICIQVTSPSPAFQPIKRNRFKRPYTRLLLLQLLSDTAVRWNHLKNDCFSKNYLVIMYGTNISRLITIKYVLFLPLFRCAKNIHGFRGQCNNVQFL
jgi:hypothetical protein